jgi:hypothetical protein
MFRRSESERERALLRLIEDQQQLIRDLGDRLLSLSGTPLSPPPLTPERFEEEEPEMLYSALDGLPPTYQGMEE